MNAQYDAKMANWYIVYKLQMPNPYNRSQIVYEGHWIAWDTAVCYA